VMETLESLRRQRDEYICAIAYVLSHRDEAGRLDPVAAVAELRKRYRWPEPEQGESGT